MGKNIDLWFKRVFDLSFASIGIIVLSPIFIIVSILIRLDSKGKVFFLQERVGKNGKVFKIYKFRTMINNAEKQGMGIFTNESDSRITKLGNILRKTSLDELPQLINVLKGDMSVVGPRPPVTYHPHKYKEYSDFQRKRFEVLPGITGYAQALGRNSLTWDERIVLDVEYVERRNLIFDIKIIFMTVVSILKKESIYREKKEETKKGKSNEETINV